MRRIAEWLRNEMADTHARGGDHPTIELVMLKGGLDYLIGQLEAGKVPAIRTARGA